MMDGTSDHDAPLAKLRHHAPELQFWGYETGNVMAAIAGAGGMALFHADLTGLLRDTSGALSLIHGLVATYPDLAATLGLAALVLATALVHGIASETGERHLGARADRVATAVGLGLILYALALAESWVTLAAVFFVTGSALLRQCDRRPVMLKLGGLSLAGGGACLAAFGGEMALAGAPWLLSVLTGLMGLHVVAASLLTYQGGIFACGPLRLHVAGVFADSGQADRWLRAHVDPVVTGLVRSAVHPALWWIPARVRAHAPFLTAMWARLPWRIAVGGLALLSGTPGGIALALANLLWALGDIAVGTLDMSPEARRARATAQLA